MRCIALKQDGTQCKTYALKGDNWCFNHHPDISEQEKKEHYSKAGKANKIAPYKLSNIDINTAQDVPKVLIDTIHRVRANKIDLKVATTIGGLCLNLVKAYDVAEHEKRIDAIEKAMNNENPNVFDFKQVNETV